VFACYQLLFIFVCLFLLQQNLFSFLAHFPFRELAPTPSPRYFSNYIFREGNLRIKIFFFLLLVFKNKKETQFRFHIFSSPISLSKKKKILSKTKTTKKTYDCSHRFYLKKEGIVSLQKEKKRYKSVVGFEMREEEKKVFKIFIRTSRSNYFFLLKQMLGEYLVHLKYY